MYLVCGEALFDVFLDSGDDPRAVRFDARAGGSPFNVAVGIARLGGRAALLTGVSTDALGARLARLLELESVSTEYLVRSGRRTTLSLVALDAAGQPQYVFYGLGSADCNLSIEDLPAIGDEITGLHFGSYSLVVRPVADAFAALASAARGRFISVDPNVRPTVEPDLDIWRARVAEYAARADLLKISAEDLASLYPGASRERKAADWIAAGVRLVVVTDSSSEMAAWTAGGHAVRLKPPACEVVDTVGAGDSFQSALLARLARLGHPKSVMAALEERTLRDLLTFAMQAAAITCSRRGADPPRLHELPEEWW